MRVLVTGAGGPAAFSFMRAVSIEGPDLFAADMDPLAPGLYLVPHDHRVLVRPGADPLFVEDLLEACTALEIDVLVPTVDCELLPIAQSRHLFEAIGTRVMVADEKTLRLCQDKARLLEVCEGVVPLPRWTVVDPDMDLRAWDLPAFAKPRTGSGSRGIRRVDSIGDLAHLPTSGEMLLQDFLPGEEYSVDVLCDQRGEIIAAVPRARLRVDSGVAITARTVQDEELHLYAKRTARAIGLRGVANVQFKRDSRGTPRLLEVNPRFPGTMPLTVAAGVNMPLLALHDLMGLEVPRHVPFRPLAMTRTFHEHYFEPSEISDLRAQRARRVMAAPAEHEASLTSLQTQASPAA